MRRNTALESTDDSTLCRWLSPTLYSLPSFILDVDICRNADVTSTKALLATLQTAVESYLGTNICFAAFTLDHVEGHRVDVAQEALQALGLRQVMPTGLTAKNVVYAHRGNTFPRFDQEPWVVLAVDYSFNWFNVGLYTIGEGGIVDPIEVNDAARGPQIGEDNQLDALKNTLRQLFANSLSNVSLPDQIRHLYVYGDDAKNNALHHLLATILNADLVRDARVVSSVYDSVFEMAYSAHGVMDTIDFETEVPAAFGCKWRSKLYSGDQNIEL